MSGWRKRQIAEIQRDVMNEQLLAEEMAMESALRFLNGWPRWNDDDLICRVANEDGLDGNLIWLTRQVLMGPAVVHLSTGKVV
jgi:hypothetical protein